MVRSPSRLASTSPRRTHLRCRAQVSSHDSSSHTVRHSNTALSIAPTALTNILGRSCSTCQNAPISKECAVLEAAIGGPQKLANLTGSRAYEPQI
ncbi:hypothetical protein JVT61DRAFT_241 [Boletus reticuloceps]|uniref:Uncharacterized protein n=1 Tax=Boletus reticuloceps TaxID=495285 RepID=A0A8I2Z1A6_9AGAM|nr:hypothetical protein JVT61DRAFT_241 [Boletus reticuloceps]